MSSDWMDEFTNGDWSLNEGNLEDFYCPYTNKAECALNTTRMKPQELCQAIECDQLKFYQARRRQKKAA
jgi:hypothetical protein